MVKQRINYGAGAFMTWVLTDNGSIAHAFPHNWHVARSAFSLLLFLALVWKALHTVPEKS